MSNCCYQFSKVDVETNGVERVLSGAFDITIVFQVSTQNKSRKVLHWKFEHLFLQKLLHLYGHVISICEGRLSSKPKKYSVV